MEKLKKCSDCRYLRGCGISLAIKRSNRKNLMIYLENELLESYSDIFANICHLYKKEE